LSLVLGQVFQVTIEIHNRRILFSEKEYMVR
jgi:hypothetical protein